MADVINVDFIEDSQDTIPPIPEVLEDQACDTLGAVLSTIWAAGYLIGYDDACTSEEDKQ